MRSFQFAAIVILNAKFVLDCSTRSVIYVPKVSGSMKLVVLIPVHPEASNKLQKMENKNVKNVTHPARNALDPPTQNA